MELMKNILGLILFAAAISACSFGEKNKQVVETSEVEAIAQYVDYRIEKIDEKHGPCLTDSTTKQCILFQIEYPVITGKVDQAIAQVINKNIKADILEMAMGAENAESFQAFIDELSGSYDSLINDFDDYAQSWGFEINSDILFQHQNFISVATSVFTYTGGAHPNNSQVYRSYDLRTGQAIRLDNILQEGYAAALNNAAEIEFRMLKEIPPSESLESAGYWLKEGVFQLNNNFAIINQSLMFYFNPYEIGPYALGATELELKLSDYGALIKAEGAIGYLKQ